MRTRLQAAARGSERAWGWLPHLLMGLLAIPFIVRQNSWYEWANSLWLLELQTKHVAAHGLPTYFIDSSGTYFYPSQLFYAGLMFGLLSYPALVLGPWTVFAITIVLAFVAASAGVSWTARNLGVPPRLAVLPGVMFAATPYVVSNLYGRGDWAELVATGFLAVAVGAATSLLTGRARSVPIIVVVLALAVGGIAATHNLTTLLAALFAPLLGLALLPVLPGPRRVLLRRLALVVGGAGLGAALCGVFLIPNLWLGRSTDLGSGGYHFLNDLHGFGQPGIIFDPLPGQPAEGAGTFVHTQTLAACLLWVVAMIAVAGRRHWLGRRQLTTLGLLGLVGVGLTLLIADPSWWLSFPRFIGSVQFPFRLVTYLALLTVVGTAVLLAAPAIRTSRTAVGLLLVATAWQLGIAGFLAVDAQPRGTQHAPTSGSVRPTHLPASFAQGQQIQFRLLPVAHPLPTPARRARVAPVGDDAPSVVHLFGSQQAGTLVATAVVASPLIRISGDARFAGTTADGLEVLRVTHSPWRATIQAVCSTCIKAIGGSLPLALLAGRVSSVLAVLVVLALLGFELRTRRAKPSRATGV